MDFQLVTEEDYPDIDTGTFPSYDLGPPPTFIQDSEPVAFWGDTFVTASQLPDQRWVLDAVFAAEFSQGCVINWRGFPLAAYTDGLGHYSLCVVEYTGDLYSEIDSYVYKQLKYAAYRLPTGTGLLTLRDVSASTVIAGTTRFRGMPLAYNDNNTLLFVPCGIDSFDQDSTLDINGQSLLVRRAGTVWYLAYAAVS